MRNRRSVAPSMGPVSGPYTHRVAISNIVCFFCGWQITCRWRDSAHNNEQKLLTLTSINPAPICVARASERLRAHPELRLPCQPQATPTAPALLSSAWRGATEEKDISEQQRIKRSLACPKLWETDDGHRKTHCYRNQLRSPPTLGTAAAETTRSNTKPLRASARSSFYALPFHKPGHTAFSSAALN